MEDKSSDRPPLVIFVIPRRAMVCKGIITGWEKTASIEELYEAITNREKIIEIERITSRKCKGSEKGRSSEDRFS